MSGPFTHITNIETQNIYLGFFFPIPSLFLCIFTHGRNIPDSQKQSQTFISFPKICTDPEVSIPQSSMSKGMFLHWSSNFSAETSTILWYILCWAAGQHSSRLNKGSAVIYNLLSRRSAFLNVSYWQEYFHFWHHAWAQLYKKGILNSFWQK